MRVRHLNRLLAVFRLGGDRGIYPVEGRQCAFMLDVDVHPSSLDNIDIVGFEPKE
jgi:hypothetical protein